MCIISVFDSVVVSDYENGLILCTNARVLNQHGLEDWIPYVLLSSKSDGVSGGKQATSQDCEGCELRAVWRNLFAYVFQ